MKIIRTDEQMNAARDRAQATAFAAEDAGETDDAANAVYELFQWLEGNTDTDPTAEMSPEDYAEGADE
jgi:hypothetical protein